MTEIPVIVPEIIEYQCPRVVCPGCGYGRRAPVPGETQGQFGPHLTALIAYLTVVCRLLRRVVEGMLEHLFGVEISLGSTQKCWEETSAAVAVPCAEFQQRLKDQSVLNIDETGWRTDGKKRYLWAFVASTFVVFTVAQTRGSALLIQMLGAAPEAIAGSIATDRRHGEIATARLLTVTQTCKQQRRPALRYLTAAVIAHRRRQPVPSLLSYQTSRDG